MITGLGKHTHALAHCGSNPTPTLDSLTPALTAASTVNERRVLLCQLKLRSRVSPKIEGLVIARNTFESWSHKPLGTSPYAHVEPATPAPVYCRHRLKSPLRPSCFDFMAEHTRPQTTRAAVATGEPLNMMRRYAPYMIEGGVRVRQVRRR